MRLLNTVGFMMLASIGLATGCSQQPQDDSANSVASKVWHLMLTEGEKAALGQDPTLTFPEEANLNGKQLNGKQLNGKQLNGTSMNGNTLTNVAASNGGTSGGATLQAVEEVSGLTISGAGFVGAVLWGVLSDGTLVQIKVQSYNSVIAAPLDAYYVTTMDGQPICGYQSDGVTPQLAVPMQQTYNPITGKKQALENDLFTLACRGAAIEKCNEYGYPEWQQHNESYSSSTKTRNLDSWHQSCIFMIRADYCGDGQTHTRDGTPIDIIDQLGIQTEGTNGAIDPTYGPWSREAEWSTDGAWCIHHTRWMPDSATSNHDRSNPHWAYILDNCPERIAGYTSSSFPVAKPCDGASTWNPQYGFNISNQDNRNVLKNNTPQYVYSGL